MTVSVDDRLVSHAGDGANKVFSYDFDIYSDSELLVQVRDADTGLVVDQVLNTDYTVEGAGGSGTKQITFTAAPENNSTIIICGDTTLSQTTDYGTSDTFPASSHETGLDRQTRTLQEIDSLLKRTIHVDRDEAVADWDGSIPRLADRKSKILAFSADGKSLTATTNDGSSTSVSAPWVSTPRTLQDLLKQKIPLRDFCDPISAGSVLANWTDQKSGIDKWLAAATTYGLPLECDEGVYPTTGGHVIPANCIIEGPGGAHLFPYPAASGQKALLRPGYHDQLPGCNFIAIGTSAAAAETTARAEAELTGFKPVFKSDGQHQVHITGFTILQYMDVLDVAGATTSPSADNRASSHTAGLYLKNINHSLIEVGVFGYFDDFGVFLYCDDTPNADYNVFRNGFSCGEYGFAICNDGVDGLSGTSIDESWGLFARDHHSRETGATGIWGKHCLYINGETAGGGINGHAVRAYTVRSAVDEPVKLDWCRNLKLDITAFETPDFAGSTGATTTKIVGTANTGRVTLIANRLNDQALHGTGKLCTEAAGPVIVLGPNIFGEGIEVWEGGKGVRINANAGDSSIQLTDESASNVSGWKWLRDDSDSDKLKLLWNNSARMTLPTSGYLPISDGDTGGSGSAGAGNQYVEIKINNTTYKVLHDGTV